MQQINLLHPEFRRRPRGRLSRHQWLAVAAALVVAGVAVKGALTYRQIQQLEADLRQADREFAAVKARLDSLDQALRKDAATPATAPPAADYTAALAEAHARDRFATGNGYSAYLLALAREGVAGLWLTRVEIGGAGKALTLAGRCAEPELLAHYLDQFAATDTLRDLKFNTFRMAPPQEQAQTQTQTRDYLEFYVASEHPHEGTN